MKQICVNCRKKLLIKIILNVLDVKPSELAKDLHLSKTQVSRYISGERISGELDAYLIEQVFEIRVKEYDRIQYCSTAAKMA